MTKVSYIDLNHHDHYESYCIKPKKYGGGRIFASWAKELLDDFHIYSIEKSFLDICDTENKNNCHTISQEQINAIKNGQLLSSVLPETNNSDIILHHFSNQWINTNIPQAVWAVGVNEYIHPNIEHLMLYSRNRQRCILTNSNTKIYDIVIGVDCPDSFSPNKKEDFIFQCSRHNEQFGSAKVASFCNKYHITAYFAGPIDNSYNFLQFIDDKNTFYLGEIEEAEKISFSKRARASTFLHGWPTPFNLSAITSLSHGTPVITSNSGFWPDLVISGQNGFIIDINNEQELLDAWHSTAYIDQKNCYESVYPRYNTRSMIDSFELNILKILQET